MTRLTTREREVLEAIDRCDAVTLTALEEHFSTRFPGGKDEVGVVVDLLVQKRAVNEMRATRSYVYSTTALGRLALKKVPA
jgi:predicted transcriptional regulator